MAPVETGIIPVLIGLYATAMQLLLQNVPAQGDGRLLGGVGVVLLQAGRHDVARNLLQSTAEHHRTHNRNNLQEFYTKSTKNKAAEKIPQFTVTSVTK